MANEIDKSVPGAWRGYLVLYGDQYEGGIITKDTRFDSPQFVGQLLPGIGEIFRCSKDDKGLFIAARSRNATATATHWTHTVDADRVLIEFELDKTSGETRAIVKKYPLQSISTEVKHDAQSDTHVVVIT